MSARPTDELCRFNYGVECAKKDNCEDCGWNPRVSAKRLVEYKKTHQENIRKRNVVKATNEYTKLLEEENENLKKIVQSGRAHEAHLQRELDAKRDEVLRVMGINRHLQQKLALAEEAISKTATKEDIGRMEGWLK